MVRWSSLSGMSTKQRSSITSGLWGSAKIRNRGLYYNRFRYYSPETGQYISPDPLGLAGGFNQYGYVDNPVKYVDPLGLIKSCPPPEIRGTQTGFRNPQQIDGIKRDMLNGSFDFQNIEKRIGGYLNRFS
ncbi:RHS repeat-associated core domain-containing protein [Xenorhabdus griffiniae]|uniref:RHS repeat-associated core domain-containing protein n=1 Tax=Xenorhabdus griffiniae TaxID=351672 RepID=A0ABY9XNN1_9GAMM|nr:RHS repeat-associated core domain-containing protein [Xenorhabdus griffiniae]WMV74531.1 RHS repeat-associated core domain-containing protein [Xenorhabdus griffiniae]WNH04210.1 RHS repeat-associated core domain-containing protein [Xenorhabdus griffiniae]